MLTGRTPDRRIFAEVFAPSGRLHAGIVVYCRLA
jgi:hypothetical protein